MELRHVDIVFQIVVFLFAISFHESAHAWMASRCGDPTARMLGRVSLNPIRHIDPIGTVLLPALAMLYHFPMVGWAKPTPVDPRNFKDPVRSDVLTSVAGPVSNFVVAVGAVAALALVSVSSRVGHAVVRNIASGFLTETDSLLMPLTLLLYQAMVINILLGVFNLIPVPPLDGSHVLRHFLSDAGRRVYDTLGWAGLLLLFTVGGQFVGFLMWPVVHFFNALLMRI